MPVRSIRIYNATTEEWEPLGVSQLDLTTALDAKPDLFVASSTPGTFGAGDFWLDTSATI